MGRVRSFFLFFSLLSSFLGGKLVEVQLGLQSESKPSWELEWVLPIYQTTKTWKHTFFTQGRFSYHGGEGTYNIGLGYRYLFWDDCLLLGGNVFFDVMPRYWHRRMGYGVEVLHSFLRGRANIYQAWSGRLKQPWIHGIQHSERVLDGYDGELEWDVPYLPWFSLAGGGYHWKGHSLPSLNGARVRFMAQLSAWCRLEWGGVFDQKSSDAFVECVVQPWGRKQASLCEEGKRRSLRDWTLAKVRRHHDLVIERRAVGGVGVIIGRGT